MAFSDHFQAFFNNGPLNNICSTQKVGIIKCLQISQIVQAHGADGPQALWHVGGLAPWVVHQMGRNKNFTMKTIYKKELLLIKVFH